MYDLGKKPVRSGPAPFRYWLSVVPVSAVIASLSMTARFGDSQAVAEASSADTSAAVEPAAEWQSDNGLGSNLSATGQVYGGGHGTAGAGTQPPSATTS